MCERGLAPEEENGYGGTASELMGTQVQQPSMYANRNRGRGWAVGGGGRENAEEKQIGSQ